MKVIDAIGRDVPDLNDRDKYKRVHFSCDGTVRLLDRVGSHVRIGDTASGTDPDDGMLMFWTCLHLTAAGAVWEADALWSERGANERVAAADLMVVISDRL